MPYAYIKHPGGDLEFVEIIYITPTAGVPPRPHPGPTPPTDGGPVDPGYGIPETGLPGWSKAAVGPAGPHMTPPADVALAANYAWSVVVYPDKSAAWAQVGPKIEHWK